MRTKDKGQKTQDTKIRSQVSGANTKDKRKKTNE